MPEHIKLGETFNKSNCLIGKIQITETMRVNVLNHGVYKLNQRQICVGKDKY